VKRLFQLYNGTLSKLPVGFKDLNCSLNARISALLPAFLSARLDISGSEKPAAGKSNLVEKYLISASEVGALEGMDDPAPKSRTACSGCILLMTL
jgi:hypothetical protein